MLLQLALEKFTKKYNLNLDVNKLDNEIDVTLLTSINQKSNYMNELRRLENLAIL